VQPSGVTSYFDVSKYDIVSLKILRFAFRSRVQDRLCGNSKGFVVFNHGFLKCLSGSACSLAACRLAGQLSSSVARDERQPDSCPSRGL